MRVAGHRVTMYRTHDRHRHPHRRQPGEPRRRTPQALPGGGTIGTYGLDGTVIVVWPDGSLAIVRAVGVFPEYFRFTVDLGLSSGAPRARGRPARQRRRQRSERPRHPRRSARHLPEHAVRRALRHVHQQLADQQRRVDVRLRAGPDARRRSPTSPIPDAPATRDLLPAAARRPATATCNLFGLTDSGAARTRASSTSASPATPTSPPARRTRRSAASASRPTPVRRQLGDRADRRHHDRRARTRCARSPATAGSEAGLRDHRQHVHAERRRHHHSRPERHPSSGIFVQRPTGFRDVFTAPADGTYTMSIDPRGTATGTLTFELIAVPDNTGTTTIGTPTTVTTTTIGENADPHLHRHRRPEARHARSPRNTFSAGVGSTSALTPNNRFVAGLFADDADRVPRRVHPPDHRHLPVDRRPTRPADRHASRSASPPSTTTPAPPRSAPRPPSPPRPSARTPPARSPAPPGRSSTSTIAGNTFVAGVELDIAVRQQVRRSPPDCSSDQPTGFRDVFTLPTTGTYTVDVDPRDQTDRHASRSCSAPCRDNTGTTTIGTPTTVTTTTIGENADPHVHRHRRPEARPATSSANTFSTDGVDIDVRATRQAVRRRRCSLDQPTGFRDVFTLPTTGTYTVVVDPRDQQTGTSRSCLAAVPDNTGTTAIGTPTTVTTTTIGENADPHVHRHRRAEARRSRLRQHLHATASTSTSARRRQHSPGGLFTDDPTGFRDVFTLPTTGTYTIDVDPRDQQTGTVTFLLGPVTDNTGTTTIGTPTTVTTTTIGENATRTFTGTAGQRLTLSVSGNTLSGGVDRACTNRATATRRRAVLGPPDRVPRRVHPAGHRHLHGHGRPSRPADRHPDVRARQRACGAGRRCRRPSPVVRPVDGGERSDRTVRPRRGRRSVTRAGRRHGDPGRCAGDHAEPDDHRRRAAGQRPCRDRPTSPASD